MRFFHLLAAAALLPVAASAQKMMLPEPITCRLVPGAEPAPLYLALKDSAKAKPWRTLKRTDEVRVLGQATPQWVIVAGPDANYFLRQRELANCPVPSDAPAAGQPLALPIDAGTKLITYTQVVLVPGATKNELYTRGKVWFAKTFKSAQSVIQADEREAGVLIGKGWQSVSVRVLGTPLATKLWYTIKLSFKEGKYRYELTNFLFEGEPTPYDRNPAVVSAENCTTQTSKKGEVTVAARNHASSLSATVQDAEASLRATMSQPAAGGDW